MINAKNVLPTAYVIAAEAAPAPLTEKAMALLRRVSKNAVRPSAKARSTTYAMKIPNSRPAAAQNASNKSVPRKMMMMTMMAAAAYLASLIRKDGKILSRPAAVV